MAEPQLELHERVKKLVEDYEKLEKLLIEVRLTRIEKAVSTLTAWLVSAQTGFNQKDMEGINDILFGRTEAAPEEGTKPTE